MAETTTNPHLLYKGIIQMVYSSLNDGLMVSHKIFVTTADLANVRRKVKN